MRADELLTEIEPLSYRARCRRLADLRRSAGDPALAGLLAELGRGGHYERRVGLFIAAAVRDEASLAHLAAAMADRDRELSTMAFTLGVRFGVGAEAFGEGLADAPAAVRAAVYEAVRKSRRADLAERLIGAVAARWGEAEAAALLSTCGRDAARDLVDGLAHAVPNWKSFGLAHPGLMLDLAERRLADTPEGLIPAWWTRYGPGVAAAAGRDPGRVVGLLERHWRSGGFPADLAPKAGVLLEAEPGRMLRLLLAPEHRRWLAGLLRRRSVRDRVARLGDADLIAVARAVRDNGEALRLLLEAFAPSRRERVFDSAMEGIDLAAVEFDDALLEVLPRSVRTREARRMLALHRIAGVPGLSWRVTAFLPYEEALPVLAAVARRPDADDRATGYRLLIRCAGRSLDPEVLTALLESLGRLRNEQDPVRQTALTALAGIPEGLFQRVHAPAVGQFADDALNARDCSHGTRYALANIAAGFCRQGAMRDDADLVVFALGLFEKLIGHAGAFSLNGLSQVLRRGQEHRLARTLAPFLRSGADRDDHRLALLLATALGRRAHDVPEIQDALEAALDARSDAVLKRAISLWLAPPGPRAERVERLVERDASTVAVPAVFAAIARERTDLLHLLLPPLVPGAPSGRSRPSGRFRRPDVTYVPIVDPSWTRRWTGRQHAAYLSVLDRLAGDPGVPDADRGRAVRAIGTVPGVDRARLRPHLDSGDAFVRRAALTAAPWSASPQDVLPDLLALASSDDAHVAVYAAGRAARFVSPAALSAALAPVLATGKITARKEALRMLLRNRVPDAMDVVTAAWDAPGQHPDVRAAIVSAARAHLADPAAERILAEAAAGPRDLARQVVGVPPLQVEERFRARYAALVLRVARSDDPEARDAALPGVPAWAPWAPDAPAVLAGLGTDLDVAHGWRSALGALVECVAAGIGGGELGAAADALAAAPALPDAGAERDLPALQRLADLVATVRRTSAYDPDGAQRAVRALDGHLPEPLASELAAATLRWDGPDAAAAVDALADRWAGGGALAILEVAGALAGGGPDDPDDLFDDDFDDDDFDDDEDDDGDDRHEPGELLSHAVRLAGRGDLSGGLFACALTARHGPRAGWPEEWRALLRRLRADEHPDVAFSARAVRTADE